ncbi:PD-(D/E)XK motif protein [Modestobacter roseus]|nr:PD-(D/E)XK motif protein [Modestobacter roseus]
MTPEELQSRWREIIIPASGRELQAIQVLGQSGVWVARDHSARPHLLVRIPDGASFNAAETHGLGVGVGRHRIMGLPDATYVDFVCLDQAVLHTFAAVTSDLVRAVLEADLDARREKLLSVLSEWRWFWGVDPSRLSATDALGLFGELWFLVRWVGVSSKAIEAWDASNGARHDFQWPAQSVEVKTTSSGGAVVHNIERLEQLEDAETGQLYLFSLRVSRDALGANTLAGLVHAATGALADDPAARSELLAKLSRRGYTPAADEHARVPFRVVDEALYRVADSFPRLTRASFADGLPPAITKLSYQLDMNACADWRVAETPDTARFR